MNISYKWLKEYVDFDMTAEEVAVALTSIGLEVGAVEEVQTIRGGLKGLVVGHVLTCEVHPNSDHMHITTVDLGNPRRSYVVLTMLQLVKRSSLPRLAQSCMTVIASLLSRSPNFVV